MKSINRRSVLRGALNGAAVGLGLPLLNLFLDDNGKALAATGQRIPVRFGTWIWGCGYIPEKWIPEKTGTDFTLPADLQPLLPYKDKLALFSGFDVKLDGIPNKPHVTGCLGLRTGVPVPDYQVEVPTLDVLIADSLGKDTRFRSIEVSTSGVQRSYSYRAKNAPNPSETSPLALYQRIFGEGFQDPNAKSFKPDPKVMVHKSVLSAVAEDRQRLMRQVGAEDRHRLDEYFTSLRQLEQQLALQLEPPAPVKGFLMTTHKLMAELLARALQCNQTHIVNVLLSDTTSNLRRAGSTTTHHTLTHEEPVNPELGYQEQVGWFATKSMEAWRDFLAALDAIPEGDGTLLDNCLILAHSDCSIAKSHAVEGIPTMIAGNAGGKVRTGFHMAGNADPISRIGLSVQQVLGLPIERWGTRAMETSKTINEIFA